METLQNYIGGRFVASSSFIESFNPSTGKVAFQLMRALQEQVFAQVPNSSAEDVNAAVQAAVAAFPRHTRLRPR
jgi:aminomuconate-semialdehyde/2-hydroxymuconate-6-semialdehyde dehydrogenase